jgi:hypothetical protein
MKNDLKAFYAGAFGLIALYLVLAHASGLAKAISSGASGSSTIFKTLQGR